MDPAAGLEGSSGFGVAAVLALQRTAGNRAVGALLKSRRLDREPAPAEAAPAAAAVWVETSDSAVSASLANWNDLYGAIDRLPPGAVIIIPTAGSGPVGVVKGERFDGSGPRREPWVLLAGWRCWS